MIRLGAENKRLKEQLERELQLSADAKLELNETIEQLQNERNDLNDRINKLQQVI